MTAMNYNSSDYSHLPFIFDTLLKGFSVIKETKYPIIKLEIGSKYYTFKKGHLKAFKVLSIAFYTDRIDYDIEYADGICDSIDGRITNIVHNPFVYNIFKNKESFFNFRESGNDIYKYREATTTYNLINQYDNCLTRYYRKDLDADLIIPRVYVLNSQAKPTLYRDMFYDSLWIDSKGLHYKSHDISNNKLFWSEIECYNSLLIDDFEDDEKTKETITYEIKIPLSESKEFILKMKSIGIDIQ